MIKNVLATCLVVSAMITGTAATTQYELTHTWSSKASMPLPRSDMTASTVGDVIVLAGGCVGNQTVTDWGGYACDAITAETLIYSPKEDKYTVVADAPRPRYRHAAAVVGTKVYLLGGTNLDVDEYFNEIMVEAVDVFDTVTSKWTTLDQLHPAVTTDPAAFATGTKIVYTGGYVTTNNYNATKATWVLDTALSTTDAGSGSGSGPPKGWTKAADALTARGDLGMVNFEYKDGDKLITDTGFAFGGWTHEDGFASPLAQLESYNVGNDIWTALTSMPTVRGDKAAAVLNGQLHVIGGETKSADGVTAAISDVEVYNPTTNTWVDEGPIPSERFRFVAAAVDDTIYVFGGQTFRFGEHLAPGSYYAVVDTVEAFQEIVNSKSSAHELTGGCILSILITVVGAATAF